MTTFIDLGLAAPLLKSLNSQKYTAPTPIQAKAIPSILAARDLLGIAQTGTGKTGAFALPVLQRLSQTPGKTPANGCRALVLSPTRELASQIADSFRVYGRHMNLTTGTVFGGVTRGPQRRLLSKGVDVLVATPGRLLDHIGAGAANLKTCEILILDEADQMLDLGFLSPIRKIVSRTPKTRQTLFFSATMPTAISRLAREFLHDPVSVSVAPVSSTAERVTQKIVHVPQQRKPVVLSELLADPAMTRAIVFARTKRGADRVAKHLDKSGVKAAAIHGNKSQNQRDRSLTAFRKSKITVLVATDIASRGIDIDDISHVINFDLPNVPEAYVHRIGRTARAGASGCAISLCDPSEKPQLRAIEKLTRQKIAVKKVEATTAPEAPDAPDATTGADRPNASPTARRRRKRPASPSRQKTAALEPRERNGKSKKAQKPDRRARRRRPSRVAEAVS